MKVGIFDIGSNSVRFFVAEKQERKWSFGSKMLWTTRLGKKEEGLSLLKEERMLQTLTALAEGMQAGKKDGVDQFYAYATAAVREADNRETFLQMVKNELSLEVNVLSGEQEASLSFFGAVQESLAKADSCLVVDIGGSSTELAWGDAKGLFWFQSYPMGAVRFQQLSLSGPQRIWQEAELMWDNLPKEKYSGPDVVFGVGGTITTLAAIDLKMDVYDAKRIQGHCLTRAAVEGHIQFLRYATIEERADVCGLPAQRRDIIVAGGEILCAFMDRYGVEQIIVSDCDGMEGFALQLEA